MNQRRIGIILLVCGGLLIGVGIVCLVAAFVAGSLLLTYASVASSALSPLLLTAGAVLLATSR